MRRIVVAEQEPFLARMLRLALVRSGYRVSTFDDGEAALEFMLDDPPDAMIAATDLPGVGAEELCRRMRARLINRDLPSILMSNRSDKGLRDRAQQYGRVEVVDKPISMRTLLGHLDGFFAGDSMVDTFVGQDRIR